MKNNIAQNGHKGPVDNFNPSLISFIIQRVKRALTALTGRLKPPVLMPIDPYMLNLGDVVIDQKTYKPIMITAVHAHKILFRTKTGRHGFSGTQYAMLPKDFAASYGRPKRNDED